MAQIRLLIQIIPERGLRAHSSIRAPASPMPGNEEASGMNHRHRKVLQALFAHPTSANIHLSDVETVLADLGAELETSSHGRLTVRLNGQARTFAHAGRTVPPDEVRQIRRFLEEAGIDPAAYPV
jgi:hypothetical protein